MPDSVTTHASLPLNITASTWLDLLLDAYGSLCLPHPCLSHFSQSGKLSPAIHIRAPQLTWPRDSQPP